MNPWLVLGISETTDKNVVRHVYMQLISKHNPEDDPEGFQRVRTAYEMALVEIDEKEAQENDDSPVGVFMKKFDALYKDFAKRINPDNWSELLKDDICISLDTEDLVNTSVLNYLYSNYFMPPDVWKVFEKTFNWKERADELSKKYHPNFINFIVRSPDTKKSIYPHFDVSEPRDFDLFISKIDTLIKFLDNRQLEEAEPVIAEIEALDIKHPTFSLAKAHFLALKKNPDEALLLVQSVSTEYGDDYDNDDIYLNYVSACAFYAYDTEENYLLAEGRYRHILSINPLHYYAQLDLAETMVKLNKLEEARSFVGHELLDRYPSNDYVRSMYIGINNMIIEKYQKLYNENEENPTDIINGEVEEIIFTLANSYLAVQKYDELYNLLVKHTDLNPARYYNIFAASCYYVRKYEEGVEAGRKAVEIEPTYRAYSDLIVNVLSLKQYEEVIKIAEEALTNLQDSKENDLAKVEIYTQLANSYFWLKEYGKSNEILDEALKINGNIASIYANKAENLMEMQYYQEAIDQAEISISIAPYNSYPYEIEADVYYRTRNDKQVLQVHERAANLKISSPGLEYFKICANTPDLTVEEIVSAFKELAKAEYLGKWEEKIHTQIASAYSSKSDFENALVHATKALDVALKHGRENDALFCSKIYYLSQLKRDDEELQTINDGLGIFPNSKSLLRDLGYYFDKSNVDSAIEVWEQLIEKDNTFTTAYLRLGMNLTKKKLYDEAIEILNKGLEIIPENPNLYARRGYTYRAMRKFEDAIRDLLAAAENPRNYAFWYRKHDLYADVASIYGSDLNDIENDIKYLKLSLEANDKHSENLSSYAAALLLVDQYEEALEYFNKSLELEPEDDYSLYTRGYTYTQLGKNDLAEADYKKVIELAKAKEITHHRTYRFMAMAYIRLGKLQDASDAIGKGKEMEKKDSPNNPCFCMYQVSAVYFKVQNKLEQALEEIEMAIKLKNSVANHKIKQEILGMM